MDIAQLNHINWQRPMTEGLPTHTQQQLNGFVLDYTAAVDTLAIQIQP